MKNELLLATSVQGQMHRWDSEYSTKDLISSKTDKPATVVRNYVEKNGLKGVSKVLEHGFGLGRNLRFLLENGVEEVWGTEISRKAANLANDLFIHLGQIVRVNLLNISADTQLDLPDNYFDLVLEIMVMHSLNNEQRMQELNEIKRLLKPGGRVLLHTLAQEDPAAQDLITKNPANEPGSYWFSNKSGQIFVEKTFTRQELLDLFAPLKSVALDLVTTETPFGNEVYTRQYYVGVFEK